MTDDTGPRLMDIVLFDVRYPELDNIRSLNLLSSLTVPLSPSIHSLCEKKHISLLREASARQGEAQGETHP